METEQSLFTSPGYSDPTMIPKLAEDLRIAAERADEQGEGLIYRDQVPQWTKDYLSQWLQSNGALMDVSLSEAGIFGKHIQTLNVHLAIYYIQGCTVATVQWVMGESNQHAVLLLSTLSK